MKRLDFCQPSDGATCTCETRWGEVRCLKLLPGIESWFGSKIELNAQDGTLVTALNRLWDEARGDKFSQPVGVHVEPGPTPALARAARNLLECLGRHSVDGRSTHYVRIGMNRDYNDAIDALRSAIERMGR